MDLRRRTRGVTLLELLVALAILSVLAVMAYGSLAGVVPKFRLSAATRDVASVLVLTRAKAIAENRNYIVEFQGTAYRVIWDRTSTGTVNVGTSDDQVVQTVAYGRGITYFRPTTNPLPAGDIVAFDPRGIAFNITVGGQEVGVTNGAGTTRQVRVQYTGRVKTL